MRPLALSDAACTAYLYGEVLATLDTVVELYVYFGNSQKKHQPVHASLLKHSPVDGEDEHLE